jgi:hypothetical protein
LTRLLPKETNTKTKAQRTVLQSITCLHHRIAKMTPSLEHKMSSYEARRATFFQTDVAPSKSRKKVSTNAWPHPVAGSASTASSSSKASTKHHPTPSELANLGLYFLPGHADAADACALFPEGTIVSDWKAGDEVAARISSSNPDAALLTIHHSKAAGTESDGKWQWKDEKLLPTAKSMTDVRFRTFSTCWPYDGKKGWKPNSKRLAQAGFHYTPNDEEEDCATCAYCNCSLGGWEKTDDPIKEHQRRRAACPFFNCEMMKAAESVASKEVKASSAKRSRAVSKRKLKEDTADDEAVVEAQDERAKARKSEVQEAKSAKAADASTSRPRKQRKSDDNKAVDERDITTKTSRSSVKTTETGKDLAISAAQKASTPESEAQVEDTEKQAVQTTHESQPRSSIHPSPFKIPHLHSLPVPTKAEREMTVEAWLKMQLTKACDEMEREGVLRIEALSKEMIKGREQVEALLRGKPSQPATVLIA